MEIGDPMREEHEKKERKSERNKKKEAYKEMKRKRNIYFRCCSLFCMHPIIPSGTSPLKNGHNN